MQTMLKNRPPYDAEVDAEVAKEYQRLQEEKRRVRPDPSKEIEAVRTRVSDLEGSVQRLGENVEASHKRLEDMMRTILQNQGQKQVNVCEDTIGPSSSAKMMVTPALTSCTVEATTLVHEPVPATATTSMGVAYAQLPTEDHVCSDVVVDVAADANTNKRGGNNNPVSEVAAPVEDVPQEEGKKATESSAIGDPAEPELEGEPAEAMDDIDEGQPETAGNEEAHESLGPLEQVGFI